MNYSAYITKLSRYLPSKVVENQMNRLTKKTGILQRHIAAENETAADLAVQAVSRLNLSKEEKVGVDFLIFCSQSPDYILPPTACLLQDRLGLSTNCGAFDYNLGCSGYIYGLSMAKGFVESGQAKRVLLITAETYSKYTHPQDNTVVPLLAMQPQPP